MMKRFFVEKDIFMRIILLGVLIFLILPFSYFITYSFFIILYLFLFKRNKVIFKDSLSNSADIFIAPANGKVISVTESTDARKVIKLEMDYIGNYGLFLPYSCEISGFTKTEGARVWRKSKNISESNDYERYSFSLMNKIGHNTEIQLLRSFISGKPKIWLRPGDKGRVSANFGYIPFGTTLIIKLPVGSNILINELERVKAGSTIIAGLKG